MKLKNLKKMKKNVALYLFLVVIGTSSAQQNNQQSQNQFWEKVQFGGGFGLGIGSGYTDITVAPNAIYNFNEHFGLGLGLQASYNKVKDSYSSVLYGINAIGLYNPIPEVQLSVELEQVRVNTTLNTIPNSIKNNFWNTGLYFGAGYRTGNITAGLRYNVLFDKDKSVYSDALMPFVRVSF
jgi:hypothetical protein